MTTTNTMTFQNLHCALTAAACLGIFIAALPNPSSAAQKIVLLTGISSACLLGDECPETRAKKTESTGEFMGEPQVLPALLSLGWRVVSVIPVRKDDGYRAVAYSVPSSYVLLEKP